MRLWKRQQQHLKRLRTHIKEKFFKIRVCRKEFQLPSMRKMTSGKVSDNWPIIIVMPTTWRVALISRIRWWGIYVKKLKKSQIITIRITKKWWQNHRYHSRQNKTYLYHPSFIILNSSLLVRDLLKSNPHKCFWRKLRVWNRMIETTNRYTETK